MKPIEDEIDYEAKARARAEAEAPERAAQPEDPRDVAVLADLEDPGKQAPS